MRSILRQLAKYQPPPPETVKIEVKQAEHPYQKLVESLCDITDLTDPITRRRAINDALLALNDFIPPRTAGKLYPLESAVLYHLFYRHQIRLCDEPRTDAIFSDFLGAVIERDGIGEYMHMLRNSLDRTSVSIFLYRVMLAAFGARGLWDSKRDRIQKEFGFKAARALGVEPTARIAGNGLDSLKLANIEQLILGRITYIAFWEWSRGKSSGEYGNYLSDTFPAIC